MLHVDFPAPLLLVHAIATTFHWLITDVVHWMQLHCRAIMHEKDLEGIRIRMDRVRLLPPSSEGRQSCPSRNTVNTRMVIGELSRMVGHQLSTPVQSALANQIRQV